MITAPGTLPQNGLSPPFEQVEALLLDPAVLAAQPFRQDFPAEIFSRLLPMS
jgi:hypothetical protein